jgi:uncharacterized protein YceK
MKKTILILAAAAAMSGCAGMRQRAYHTGYLDGQEAALKTAVNYTRDDKALSISQVNYLFKGRLSLVQMQRLIIKD